jgi:hypothetical protein
MVTDRHIPAFDPRRHITARQLRDLGFLLGENIPDSAFARRVAVDVIPDEDLDDGSSRLGLRLLEPFQGMDAPIYAEAVA